MMKNPRFLCWACVVSLFFALSGIAFAENDKAKPDAAKQAETEHHGERAEGAAGRKESSVAMEQSVADLGGSVIFPQYSNGATAFKDRYSSYDFGTGKTLPEVLQVLGVSKSDPKETSVEDEHRFAIHAKDMVFEFFKSDRDAAWDKLSSVLEKWKTEEPQDPMVAALGKRLAIVMDNFSTQDKPKPPENDPILSKEPDIKNLTKFFREWQKVKAELVKEKETQKNDLKIAAETADPNNANKKNLMANAGADAVGKAVAMIKSGDPEKVKAGHEWIKGLSYELTKGGPRMLSMANAKNEAIQVQLPPWKDGDWSKTDKALADASVGKWGYAGEAFDQNMNAPTLAWNNGAWKAKQAVPNASTGGNDKSVVRNSNSTDSAGGLSQAAKVVSNKCLSCHANKFTFQNNQLIRKATNQIVYEEEFTKAAQTVPAMKGQLQPEEVEQVRELLKNQIY